MEQISVITLWQPWASWIMMGWKTIETRTHPRFSKLVGKRIGIHAGKLWDASATKIAWDFLDKEQREFMDHFLQVGGALLGTVQVTEHRLLTKEDSNKALIDCGQTKRWGIILSSPETCEAIPMRGAQGIWYTTYPIKNKTTRGDT